MAEAMRVHDVLTLDEAAEYLRLPRDAVERQAEAGRLPGRRIEDTWRFLRAAIDEWLARQDSRQLLLRQAGVLAQDDTLGDLLADVYTRRGRPEAG